MEAIKQTLKLKVEYEKLKKELFGNNVFVVLDDQDPKTFSITAVAD
jgi:hypothetical protein